MTDDRLRVDHTTRLRSSSTPWDGRVESWEGVAESPVFDRLADRVLELARLSKEDDVVDLGAGTGLLSLRAASQARVVHALDYSKPMLSRLDQHARRRGLSNVRCVQSDLREIPLPDESAAAVVSSYAFHHLPDEAKELALAEARRVLRPGGALVVCDMMFALSLRGANPGIVGAKIVLIARRGPMGIVRLVKNAARVATGRWEHPTTPERWREMLARRRFSEISVALVENEAGIAIARRPRERDR